MEAYLVPQRSDEWKALRLGKVTASRVADIIAKTKSGWGASRANYMADLIAERLTGCPSNRIFVTPAMQHGIDTEEEARRYYETKTGVKVQEIGFAPHPKIPYSGASPDGLAGDGLLEIKSPLTATHIDTLLGQNVPSKYITQIQWQLACSGLEWCDFVSYDPRLPESMKCFIQRVNRDQPMIENLEKSVIEFLAELDEKLKALKDMYEEVEV